MRVVWCLVLGCKGAPTVIQQAVDQDGDGYDANTDCDPGVNPVGLRRVWQGVRSPRASDRRTGTGVDRAPPWTISSSTTA